MIASSRPMVSGLIGEMVDEGVILRQGKHYVLLQRQLQPNKWKRGMLSRE